MEITTTSLAHLGLVAGIFDELDIADIIDSAIPKNRDHNIPHSTVIKAMCLNGLGFNGFGTILLDRPTHHYTTALCDLTHAILQNALKYHWMSIAFADRHCKSSG
jgi:transposase